MSEALAWPDITVGQILDLYLKDRRDPNAERKCKTPESIACHLIAARKCWGDMKLEEFAQGSRGRVKKQVVDWLEEGKSQATCRKRISFLRTAFRFAVEEEIINRVHEPVFKLPRNGPPRERFLDDERELPALLAALDSVQTPWHTRAAVELLIRTGQRVGAVRELTWSLVDFERREIRFRDTQTADERSKKRRGNKAMNDDLYNLMRWCEQFKSDKTDAVIHWRDKPCSTLSKGIQSAFKRAGLVGIRTHDLRKASASYVNLQMGGALEKAAAHIDDTPETTRRHYVQDVSRATLPAIEAVSDVIERARNKNAA